MADGGSSCSWGEAPNKGASWLSEFERADISGTHLGSAIGVDGQSFSGPAAEVFDFIRFDLGEGPDAAQSTHDVVGAKRSLTIFKRLQQRRLDSTFDLGT